MSGVIQVEGKSAGVLHPQLGEIKTDVLARRGLKDFPAVAWFTRRIDIPRCLLRASFFMSKESTGERIPIPTYDHDEGVANMIALNRVALGFHAADIAVLPWSEHRGYNTSEGRELNESAREAGDDPDDWYVANEPVDVLKISEFWFSKTKAQPKLQRLDKQIADIRRMVSLCRTRRDVYIPPSWLTPEQGAALAKSMNVPVGNLTE
jgi:hypothetical protein